MLIPGSKGQQTLEPVVKIEESASAHKHIDALMHEAYVVYQVPHLTPKDFCCLGTHFLVSITTLDLLYGCIKS